MWEAEELKGQLLKTESDLRDARAALGAESDRCAEAQRQLQHVQRQLDSLQVGLVRGSSSLTTDPVVAVNNPTALCGMISWTMRI